MLAKRWLCNMCQREWVYARDWTPADGCPGCRSPYVRVVTFTAPFAGGDIPRLSPGGESPRAIGSAEPLIDSTPPPLALVAATRATLDCDGGYL